MLFNEEKLVPHLVVLKILSDRLSCFSQRFIYCLVAFRFAPKQSKFFTAAFKLTVNAIRSMHWHLRTCLQAHFGDKLGRLQNRLN
ncbi:MAG: hypothetical protein QOJ91_1355 [Sphingomonadales bacterium]|nr:hypothetical protein [Sphingomonadales bacterium]